MKTSEEEKEEKKFVQKNRDRGIQDKARKVWNVKWEQETIKENVLAVVKRTTLGMGEHISDSTRTALATTSVTDSIGSFTGRT